MVGVLGDVTYFSVGAVEDGGGGEEEEDGSAAAAWAAKFSAF
jgi:hypothetical protein